MIAVVIRDAVLDRHRVRAGCGLGEGVPAVVRIVVGHAAEELVARADVDLGSEAVGVAAAGLRVVVVVRVAVDDQVFGRVGRGLGLWPRDLQAAVEAAVELAAVDGVAVAGDVDAVVRGAGKGEATDGVRAARDVDARTCCRFRWSPGSRGSSCLRGRRSSRCSRSTCRTCPRASTCLGRSRSRRRTLHS